MAYIPHGAIAAAHAEQERKKREEEEEKMTKYNSDELNDNWEFKIVRSDSNAFRKPEVLQALLGEESLAGWEMLEKLDDNRVRFKRPKTAKNNDFSLPAGIDPYRSRYGGLSTRLKLGLVLGVLMLGGFVSFFAVTSRGDSLSNISWSSMSTVIPVVGLMVAVIGAIFIAKRRG